MSTSRYIEINSTYRNRKQYPCPAEFVIPVSCINEKEPLKVNDPIADSYPLFAWYQVPYATSLNEFEGSKCSDPCIRKINGQYYTSLWPLNINLTDKTNPPDFDKQMHGVVNAMRFGGGTPLIPKLNPSLVFPPNQWCAPKSDTCTNKNTILNPYYLPIANYLCGALLLRFKENPTSYLNNSTPPVLPTDDPVYSYTGCVESAVISSYDPITGFVKLVTPFSDDFDSLNDWFLIDFNTDPCDTWSEYVKGGPRIFIPGGANRIDAYKGLYIKNFTASMECSKKDMYSKIITYDNIRKIAYLENPIELVQRNENFIYDTSTDPDSCDETPTFLFGSNTFSIVKNLPSISRSYMEFKLGINNGSILKLLVHSAGKGYKVGETIGSKNLNNDCAYEPFYDENGNVISVIPDYIMNTYGGQAFVGRISSVNESGGIIEIDTIQQGYNYRIQSFNLEKYDSSKCGTPIPDTHSCIKSETCAQGEYAILNITCVYQTIEVSRRDACDKKVEGQPGDFLYLPLLGQNSTTKKRAPTMPRYSYTPVIQPGVTNPPYTSCYKLLDIKRSEYPPTISCTNSEQKEIGVRQIQSILEKDITFNLFWKNGTNLGPITTYFLKKPFELTELGNNDIGQPVYVVEDDNCFSNTGYLTHQVLEILPYMKDNEFPLNYTGSTVSQNQAVCYEIKLISLILPNIPLNNTIGGIIAFYPYIYVEFSNKIDPNGGNKGIIYSNNPNASRALFKVSIRDTNNPDKTSFIKLRGEGTQTIKFKPNDYLYFRVFLNDGTLFETSKSDNSPPLPPNFFVQISAEFEIRRLV
jgi:hypothetical protein